jgi:sulfonate transport system permease protein
MIRIGPSQGNPAMIRRLDEIHAPQRALPFVAPRFAVPRPAILRSASLRLAALRFAGGALVPLALLALWHAAVSRGWVAEQLLPPPSLVASSFLELWQSGELQSHLLVSLQRVALSVGLGAGLGLPLGMALGASRTFRAYVRPTFEVVAQFPVIGWIPLLMIFLGLTESLKIAAISVGVGIPFVVQTARSLEDVPGGLLEVARAYGFGRAQRLLRVVVPSILPGLFTGLRQGIMQAWLSLVFIELLASSEGIGYLMVWGRQLLQMDLVVVGMAVIAAIGMILEGALGWAERRLLAWRRAWA